MSATWGRANKETKMNLFFIKLKTLMHQSMLHHLTHLLTQLNKYDIISLLMCHFGCLISACQRNIQTQR